MEHAVRGACDGARRRVLGDLSALAGEGPTRSLNMLVPDPGTFTPPLHIGPPTTKYTCEDANEKWDVTLLGLEIGDLTKPEDLESKVVKLLLE